MRKFGLIFSVALLVFAVSAGAIFAQDATETPSTETQSEETQAAATAWLGVAIVDQDGQVVIARVQSGSPAATADLQVGDVVVSFNGEAVSAAADLSAMVQAAAPGDAVTLEIERNGETVSVDVTLGTATDISRRGPAGRGQTQTTIDPLTLAEHLLNADLEEADGGYVVVDTLATRNPFELEVGDVVTAINGQDITTLDMQTLAASMMSSDDHILSLTVDRNGETVTLEADMMDGMGFGHDFGRDNDRSFGPRGNSDQGFGPRGGRGGMPFGDSNGDDTTPATPEAPASGSGQA
ncbi:MAG: PDZ domain-containing protein [Anaerolineae bacterium]|nr:PDZ domain-containing protein [Anaerolineae bacterium]